MILFLTVMVVNQFFLINFVVVSFIANLSHYIYN